MRAQAGLCGIHLPRSDRLNDTQVVVDHLLHLAGRRQVQAAQPFDMTAAALQELQQIAHTRSAIQFAMKSMIGV